MQSVEILSSLDQINNQTSYSSILSTATYIYFMIIMIIIRGAQGSCRTRIQKRVDMEEVVLWMKSCPLGYRLVANKIMMCCRNDFILQNDRDFTWREYNGILLSSNSAGIVR